MIFVVTWKYDIVSLLTCSTLPPQRRALWEEPHDVQSIAAASFCACVAVRDPSSPARTGHTSSFVRNGVQGSVPMDIIVPGKPASPTSAETPDDKVEMIANARLEA